MNSAASLAPGSIAIEAAGEERGHKTAGSSDYVSLYQPPQPEACDLQYELGTDAHRQPTPFRLCSPLRQPLSLAKNDVWLAKKRIAMSIGGIGFKMHEHVPPCN